VNQSALAPASRDAEAILDLTRVIRSFWAPALGGTMDLIPRRGAA
jgi:hypothetical protein